MKKSSAHLDPQAQEFIPTTTIPCSFTILHTPIYYPYQYPSTVSPDYSFNSVGLPVLPSYPPTTTATAAISCSSASSMAQICSYQVPRENPSRTLLLSSVPPDICEGALRTELEVWGPLRDLQIERLQQQRTVTAHYFDVRHAQRALSDIQQQYMLQQCLLGYSFMLRRQAGGGENSVPIPLVSPPVPRMLSPGSGQGRGLIGGCAVWAQFAVSTCGSDFDSHNQGTLVVFNLDSDVSASRLREIFEVFGPVKELRETPSKRQHRFVEFFDIRDAAKALSEMNGQKIGGKPVKIEYSRPGGQARRFCNNTTPSVTQTRSTNSSLLPRKTNYQDRFSWDHSDSSPQFYPFSNRKSALTYNRRLSYRPLSNSGSGIEEYFVQGKGRNNKTNETQVIRSPELKQQQLAGPRSFPTASSGGKNGRYGACFVFDESKAQPDSIDPRTTVMIKNIPNKYSQKLLLGMLDQHCISCNGKISDDNEPLSAYDFVYLPIDFKNKCNMGYGFVNLTSSQATWKLYKAFQMQPWEAFNSRKICEVTYARLQGLDALKEHFKNSKFACDTDEYLPAIFSPPRDGKLLTEPLAIGGYSIKRLSRLQEQNPNDDDDKVLNPLSRSPSSSPRPSQLDSAVGLGNLINNVTGDHHSPLPEILFPAVGVATCSLDSATQQLKALNCTQVS